MRMLRLKALALLCPFVAAAQVGVLQVKVLAGEGAVYNPGAKVQKPLTIQVTDEAGAPVPGAAVSFHVPEDGPGGTFANGLRTDLVLTDAEGRATLRSLLLNRTPGPFRIRITVVKDQVRAGITSAQYISGADTPAPGTPQESAQADAERAETAKPSGMVRIQRTPKADKPRSRKWIILAAVAAGGAAAGIKLAAGGSGSAAAPSTALSIGAPSITIG